LRCWQTHCLLECDSAAHMISSSLRSILLALAVFMTATASGSPEPSIRSTMRIRLMEQLTPRTATIQAGPQGLVVYDGTRERPLFTVPANGTLTIRRAQNQVSVESRFGNADTKNIRLEPQGPGGMSITVGTTRRDYSGNLFVTPERGNSALQLVNHVALEEYVASVVASEYGLGDLEGSKAMAVIARTYGLKVINSSDDSYDHVDHTASQVYRGTATVTAMARQAARDTAGEVLLHDGRLIEAVYFSSSGGHTANNEDVWQSSAHPYLRGRNDPWDQDAKHHQWTYTLDAGDVHNALKNALGLDLESVRVGSRSADGRAATIDLVPRRGKTRPISADEFRRIIREAFGQTSLKSTRFELKRRGENYVFEGGGFGHGVGLSQYGANGMAKAGKTYREILDFYYTDVQLERRSVQGNAAPSALPTTAPAPTDRLRGRFLPGSGQSSSAATVPVRPVAVPVETSSAGASVPDRGGRIDSRNTNSRTTTAPSARTAPAQNSRTETRRGW
jgi:stage II sporulation protein D